MVREGRVLISTAGKPAWGVGYSVQVLEVGAQVAIGSFGVDIAVRPGHGFAAGDKMIVGTDTNRYRLVDGVTAESLHVTDPVSVSANEYVVNLAGDNGTTEPLYDGNGLAVYTDMGYVNQAFRNTVTTDSMGFYRYHHKGIQRWELVRSANGLEALYTDTDSPSEAQVNYGTRYAHLFATSGTGTQTDPWVTAGSNPVQAALNDVPSTGGTVYMVAGYYSLGSSANAVTIPILTNELDRRAYSFIGAGRDLVFLQYSGTGAAFRYPQINNGSFGASWQSNQLVFKGFAVQQTGTPRTGNAFFMTFVSESVWENLNIGCVRMDRQAGEPDTGWDIGVRFDQPVAPPPGDNVCDFNRFDNCHFLGNKLGILGGNQCDNTVITRCSFEPRQDSNDRQSGVRIVNSSGLSITGNHFNFFNAPSGSTDPTEYQDYALRLDTDISGVLVAGNYFEANSNAIWLYSDGHQDGIIIEGNLFAMQAINGIAGPTYVHGVRAGIDSTTFAIRGLTIQGNQFQSIKNYSRGVRLGAEVQSYSFINNRYQVTGVTDSFNITRVINYEFPPASGTRYSSEGLVLDVFPESASATNDRPYIEVSHKISDTTAINLRNTLFGGGKSPRLRFSPKTDLTLDFMLEANAAGGLNFVTAAGSVIATLSQTGLLSLPMISTTGPSTLGNDSADVTTAVGRFVVRTITLDPTTNATAGTLGEVVYASTPNKFYGKHTTTASDTNWRLLGT